MIGADPGLQRKHDLLITRSQRRRKPYLEIAAVILLGFLTALSSTSPILGQSGRRNERPPLTPKQPSELPQKPPPGRPRGASDSEETIRVSSNLVPIPASVLNASGAPISGLTLDDFELKVDDRTEAISAVSTSDAAVSLALLFDNSGSVSKARLLEEQAAIEFFRRVMRPVDQAAIYSVSTVFKLEQPLTNNVEALVRTIEHFGEPEGATALLDAIAEAAIYLKPQKSRKVIVIVSDGADTVSELDFDSTVRRAQAADCQVYVVQTGYSESANLRDLIAERRMQSIAAQTGGAVYLPRVTGDLDAAFQQISADLAQQYVLSYYARQGARDGRFHKISLRVKKSPDAKVRTRNGYFSPKELTSGLVTMMWHSQSEPLPECVTSRNLLLNSIGRLRSEPGC